MNNLFHTHPIIFSIVWMIPTVAMFILLLRESNLSFEPLGTKIAITTLSLFLGILWPIPVVFVISEELLKLYARLWRRIISRIRHAK